MFSQDEQEQIKLKAIEQAMLAAGLANADHEPLLPVLENAWTATWTSPAEIVGEHCFSYACGLTEPDYAFLRTNKISPA